MKTLARLFIIAGIIPCVFGLYQLFIRENPARLSFDNYSYGRQMNVDTKSLPKSIAIPSVGINIPVYPATITNNHWQTTDAGASYLTSSVLPGEKGNSIIYAHNFLSLFGKLVNAKVGQTVVITYPDGTKKTFIITYTSVVDPKESTILAPSSDKRITLYTCTGFLDSKRFVAVALLKS